MNYQQYCIGLFADEHGYSMTVVSVDDNNIYRVVDEKYDKKKVSIKGIVEGIEKFKSEYKIVDRIYLNNLPSLLSKLPRDTYKQILDINIENGIFIVKSLINDGELYINENLEKSLKFELNNFDRQTVSHRAYSLFLGLQEFKYIVRRIPVTSFVQ